MKQNEKHHYRRAEAAAYLSISVRTLDQLKHDGDIPYCWVGRRLVLFRKKDLDAFVMSRRIAVGDRWKNMD